MMHTLSPTADPATDIDDVARLISPDGERIADRGARSLGRRCRRRTPCAASIATWCSCDASTPRASPCSARVSSDCGHRARARRRRRSERLARFRSDDFVFPSYREIGVNFVRGAVAGGLRARVARRGALDVQPVRHQHGDAADHHRRADRCTLSVTRWASSIDGTDQVAAAYFGDGATSQGDVNEAMVFASSFRAPVVFVCTNNQWAISEPVDRPGEVPDRGPRAGVRHPEPARRRQRRPGVPRGDALGRRPRPHRKRTRLHRGRDLPHGPAHDLGRPDALPGQG